MGALRIAWGITGSGHYLEESVDGIEKLLESGYDMDLFLSDAAVVVLKMYGLLERVESFKDKFSNLYNIYYDKDQAPAYPVCAHFNLKKYDLLILSPITSNSTAKMTLGIADTLITNIFAQMIKGGGPVYCFPTDIITGEIQTRIPGGGFINIHIDEFNGAIAKKLETFPKVSVFSNPGDLVAAVSEKFALS